MSNLIELAQVADPDEVQSEAEQVEAPEAAESTEGQEANPPAEEQPEGDTEEKSESAKRRERRRAQAERLRAEEAAAREQAEQAKAKLQRVQEAAKSLPIPKQEDFDTYEEFNARLSAYHQMQVMDGRETQRLEADAKEHFAKVEHIQNQQRQEAAASFALQVEEARAKHPDFDDVALSSESLPIDDRMMNSLLQSDAAAEIAYFLGKNPEIRVKMQGMDDLTMARAFGRLEAQVTAPQASRTTNAPEPITPVATGSATTTKSPDDMTPMEFKAWREAGGKF